MRAFGCQRWSLQAESCLLWLLLRKDIFRSISVTLECLSSGGFGERAIKTSMEAPNCLGLEGPSAPSPAHASPGRHPTGGPAGLQPELLQRLQHPFRSLHGRGQESTHLWNGRGPRLGHPANQSSLRRGAWPAPERLGVAQLDSARRMRQLRVAGLDPPRRTPLTPILMGSVTGRRKSRRDLCMDGRGSSSCMSTPE